MYPRDEPQYEPTGEEERWLSYAEAGYIGYEPPKIVKVPDPFEGVPPWIMRKAEKLHYQHGVPYEQMNLDDPDHTNGLDDGEEPRRPYNYPTAEEIRKML